MGEAISEATSKAPLTQAAGSRKYKRKSNRKTKRVTFVK
jgi:hypothetical protein